jgi:hypothetical protein
MSNHYNFHLTPLSTGDSISVSYGSGQFSGTEYTDNVSSLLARLLTSH